MSSSLRTSKGTPSNRSTAVERLHVLSVSDIALVREYVLTAIAAIGESMILAERNGASRELIAQLAEYQSGAADLLERLGK